MTTKFLNQAETLSEVKKPGYMGGSDYMKLVHGGLYEIPSLANFGPEDKFPAGGGKIFAATIQAGRKLILTMGEAEFEDMQGLLSAMTPNEGQKELCRMSSGVSGSVWVYALYDDGEYVAKNVDLSTVTNPHELFAGDSVYLAADDLETGRPVKVALLDR